jgi:hypothetical protein
MSNEKSSLVNLSDYSTVFCDSLQALEWAYDNGLPKSAIIRSSAPAVLWSKKKNIQNIESRWDIGEVEKFQSTIQELNKTVFDLVLSIGIRREVALVVSQSVYRFQKILYKAACLEEEDFISPRLFIYVNGKNGPDGNIMNSPWDQLLSSNPLFSMMSYTLKNDEWKVLSTQGVSLRRRFQVAGYETVIYRLAAKLMKQFPEWIFSKEILIPNENEVNIEIAAFLALRGVKITEIKSEPSLDVENTTLDINIALLLEVIMPIICTRVERWVVPSAVEITMSLFRSELEKQLGNFKLLVNNWERVITRSGKLKKAVLMNSPGGTKGLALSYVCQNNNIPLISSQHGITLEISKAHKMTHVGLDNSVADVMFSYNQKIVNIQKNTHYDKSKHYIVGMPFRLIRMKSKRVLNKLEPPIIYISTNLYQRGFSLSLKTDYDRARSEQKIVTKVLGRLPHRVCYKTYPEDNRRYSDMDPVLSDIRLTNNIELFSQKLDMRYLIPNYRILITTCATSTLGWPIMSGKPVVFINQRENSPLTDDAYASLSKGIFVFDDSDDDFYLNIREFLSQSIEKIEELWQEKTNDRKDMIKIFFSKYNGGAGKRAAQIILREYLL